MLSEPKLQAACCELVADVARDFGKVQLKVTGASMLPVIRPGDLITVQRRNPQELKTGEVILFRRNGGLTTHRSIQVGEEFFLTRGDSLPLHDSPIPPSEVLGLVESAQRNGRTVRLYPSPWQRVVATLLRRSDWFTRLYLRLSDRARRPSVSRASFEY